MKTARTLSLILAILMICTALVSCSDAATQAETTTEAAPIATTAVVTEDVTTETPAVTVAIEKLSTGDTPLNYNMLVRANRYAYLYAENTSGELISNAVYTRNCFLEEQFGIDITITEGKGSGSESANFTTYLAGMDSAYDLVCFDYWWNLELQGYFTNLLNCQEIDPDDSWWYQGWNDNITINNQLYSIVGDANLEMLENLEAMFFNKEMATDLKLDLYADVKNGNWTVERLLEVSASAAANLDDADKTNDVYGALFDKHSVVSQLFSCGLKLSEKTSEGLYSIENCGGDNSVNITSVVTSMIQNVAINYADQTARARDFTAFKERRAMIYATALYLGQSLRAASLDFDYGIIPSPKLNKDSEYISTPYGVSVFAIPVNAKSIHNSAIVLNAMNFYSSNDDNSLVPTFYDLVLKYQIANCPDDVENLDLIRDKVYVDFAFIYDVGLISVFRTAVINNTPISSALKSTVKSAKKTMENQIFKFYTEK